MSRRAPRFALVSHVLPPSSSGQAVVLHRLLRDLDPGDCCLLSVRDYARELGDSALAGDLADRVTRPLGCDYVHLPPEPYVPLRQRASIRLLSGGVDRLAGGWRLAKRAARKIKRVVAPAPAPEVVSATIPSAASALPLPLPLPPPPPEPPPPRPGLRGRAAVALQYLDDWWCVRRRAEVRAAKILENVRRRKCAAIVACSGDLIDMPAAYLAARRAGVPFHAYLFDDYATQWVPPFQRAFAEREAATMFRDAASVLVPNEFLARVYRARYRIEPVIVPNPAEIGPRPGPPGPPVRMGRPLRIVYTGAVYDAHYDAFRSLLAAIRDWKELPVELHVYTSCDRLTLERFGLVAPAVLHPAIPAAEAARKQREADIVFLPLAFRSPFPEVINTSAPGKMGELLSCGRPVLVHAPREAFVCWYVRTRGCGAVVDVQDAESLRTAIRHLDADAATTEAFVQRAWRQAELDFSVETAQERFFGALSQGRNLRCAS